MAKPIFSSQSAITIADLINRLSKTGNKKRDVENLQYIKTHFKRTADDMLRALVQVPLEPITLLGHETQVAGLASCNWLPMLRTLCNDLTNPRTTLTTRNFAEIPVSYADAAFGAMSLDIVKFLVEEIGIDANYFGLFNSNILLLSAVNGNRDVFIYLLQRFPALIFEPNQEGKNALAEFVMCELREGNHTNIEKLLREVPTVQIEGIEIAIRELILRMVYNPTPEICENPMHNTVEFFAITPRANQQNFQNLLYFLTKNFPEFVLQRNRNGQTPIHRALQVNRNLAKTILLAQPSLFLAPQMQDIQTALPDLANSFNDAQKTEFKPKIFELFFNAVRENNLENTRLLADILKDLYPNFLDSKNTEKRQVKDCFIAKVKDGNKDMVLLLANIWPKLLHETYSTSEVLESRRIKLPPYHASEDPMPFHELQEKAEYETKTVAIDDPFKMALRHERTGQEDLWQPMHEIYRKHSNGKEYEFSPEEIDKTLKFFDDSHITGRPFDPNSLLVSSIQQVSLKNNREK